MRSVAPSDVGVDPRGILDFVLAQDEAGQDMTSLVVARGGRVCAEAQWSPFRPQDRRHVYSVTKTFTSAAVGLTVDAGLLDYEDRLVDVLADHVDPADVGPLASRIRVRDCLGMATGHTVDLPHGPDDLARPWRQCLRPLLVPEPAADRGVYHYSNLASYALAAMVEIATGRSCTDLLEDHLMRPLGIDPVWRRDRRGRPLGYSGLYVRPSDLADLTQVIAEDGCRGTERLLPETWVREARSVHTDTSALADHGPDWQQGYGWQMWRSTHGYRLDGAYGQFGIVLPDLDLVVVVTEGAMNTRRTLEHVWRHLLPACDRPASLDEATLSTVLERAVAGPGSPVRDPEAPALLDAVHLRRRDGVPVLVWDDADTGETPLGTDGEWIRSRLTWERRSLDVAATARYDGDALLATVAVMSEPHLVDVHHDGIAATATWRTTPMDTHRLRDLALEDLP